jgi:hypothetical protein
LDALKDEVATLRTGLKALEMATETKKELQLLKKSLAHEIKENSGKTEETLTKMKKAIDAVGMEQKEGKSLKKSLADEIKSANEKTERELLQFKKALDALDVKKLESKSQEEWQTIRQEMEKMKAELEEKQAGKTSMDEELANIKRSIEAINLDKVRSNNDHEFGELRQELNNMRSNLKQQDEKEASLKSEIEKLKMKDATLVEKKKGLKKFFSRHFSKKAGGSSNGSNDGVNGGNPMTYSVANTITGKEDQAVTTIAPPSVIGGMHADVLPDSDEDTYNTLSINEEIMAKLSQSFDNVIETTATTVEQQPYSVEVETVMLSQSPASTSVAVAKAS